MTRLKVPLVAQILSIWMGVVFTLVAGLFPPWIAEVSYQSESARWPIGHHLFSYAEHSGRSIRIDYGYLLVEWFLIWIVVLATLWTAGRFEKEAQNAA